MVSDNGFNPMKHDCEKQGCFNKVRRPKIEIFAELLPRKISFSDVDGICEINGYFLLLEWKTLGAPLSEGTKRLLFNFCKMPRCTAIVVWGDAQTMYVEELKLYCDSSTAPAINANRENLFDWVSVWGELADRKQQATVKDFRKI